MFYDHSKHGVCLWILVLLADWDEGPNIAIILLSSLPLAQTFFNCITVLYLTVLESGTILNIKIADSSEVDCSIGYIKQVCVHRNLKASVYRIHD